MFLLAGGAYPVAIDADRGPDARPVGDHVAQLLEQVALGDVAPAPAPPREKRVNDIVVAPAAMEAHYAFTSGGQLTLLNSPSPFRQSDGRSTRSGSSRA